MDEQKYLNQENCGLFNSWSLERGNDTLIELLESHAIAWVDFPDRYKSARIHDSAIIGASSIKEIIGYDTYIVTPDNTEGINSHHLIGHSYNPRIIGFAFPKENYKTKEFMRKFLMGFGYYPHQFQELTMEPMPDTQGGN